MDDTKDITTNNNESQNLPATVNLEDKRAAVKASQESLIDAVIDSPNRAELEKQLEIFNLNQSKSNALRIVKLNDLLDKVEDQAIERFEKRPGEISNKELLDFMQVVSTQIERSQKSLDTQAILKPTVNVVTNKNELNVNVGPKLSRDSKEKVIDVVTKLLKSINSTSAEFIEEEEPIISTDYTIEESDTSNNDAK